MASSQQQQQLTLVAQPRGSALAAAKAAFPQKLYLILNDPEKEDIIRWNDDGRSFRVIDPERLGREVLGQWFKHNKFASFVRQLNMYGFRKIAQLQQGVLVPGPAEDEVHFEHPAFVRGQLEQLSLITRQRKPESSSANPAIATIQAPPVSAPITSDIPAASAAPVALPVTSTPSLITGPGPESDPQRTASQLLALEAPPSPAPTAEEQEDNPSRELVDVRQLAGGLVAVQRAQALLVGELKELRKSNAELWHHAEGVRARFDQQEATLRQLVAYIAQELPGLRREHRPASAPADHPRASKPVASIPRKRPRLLISDGSDTPLSPAPSSEQSFGPAPNPSSPVERFMHIDTPAQSTAEYFSPQPQPSTAGSTPTDPPPSIERSTSNALMPYVPSTQPNADAAALNELLSNPEQYQSLLRALTTQSPTTFPAPAPADTSASDQQLMQYEPTRWDFSHVNPAALAPPPNDVAFAHADAGAAQIGASVEELQDSLHGIMASLGIDPATLEVDPAANAALDADFDIDSFLKGMDDHPAHAFPPTQAGAFLDEVASQTSSDAGMSPAMFTTALPTAFDSTTKGLASQPRVPTDVRITNEGSTTMEGIEPTTNPITGARTRRTSKTSSASATPLAKGRTTRRKR